MKTENIVRKLKEYDSWTILCHEKPDGDTLGCALALFSLGKRMKKKVVSGGRDAVPDKYLFLPYSGEYRQLSANDVLPESLLIVVDTSTKNRSIEGLETILPLHDSVAMDHHVDNEKFCKINLVCPEASASAEIVAELMHDNFDISVDEAVCLYTALATDNGSFRFSSVTQRSHEIARILMQAGAKPNEIDSCLNESMTHEALKLWGRAMEGSELFADGTAAMLHLSASDFEELHSAPSVTENLVNQLLRIKGVKIALFVSEFDGTLKLSVRTKQPYAARDIAAFYGGGGHDQAAGAKLCGSIDKVIAELKKQVTKYAEIGLSCNK
ncbi:MAG: bifunctional oligoribonuclease/PAP phosphatase NrnA [Synergistaceae bacterium]|nr:bifunctional oligoribonuclease/PAP phosphatase NrnA [Synergistaceae bacterium]